MKTNKAVTILLTLMWAFVLTGCGGKKPPADLPKLSPCKITITQSGKPLADATVSLVKDGADLRFTIGGITKNDGTATIMTDGEWKGAPEGTYRVLVTKKIVPDTSSVAGPKSTSGDDMKVYQDELKAVSAQTKLVTDPNFMRFGTTPARITVTSAGTTETIDVGEPADLLWDDLLGGSSGSH